MDVPLHAELRSWPLIDYLGLLWPDRSHRALLDLFARGRVRSGGKPVGARRPVGELSDLALAGSLDDVASIYLGEDETDTAGNLRILHEDHRLIALSKPSGLPVVPDREKRAGSVLGFLIRRELAARTSKPPGEYLRYRVVHRIDRLTSGLVIVAKTPEAERQLALDFERRQVKKEYLAILAGVVEPACLAVNCPVVPGRKGKMRAEPAGKGKRGSGRSALTELEVLERFRDFTLVRAMPLTGRTHQIRVHAWAAGHPLAIDPLYGARPAGPRPPAIDRLTLHALRYELPETWEAPRVFVCPPPRDFEAAVKALQADGEDLNCEDWGHPSRTPPTAG